jgi:excinuclease ABC subunit A
VRKAGIEQRLAESIELAAKLGGGLVKVSPLEGDDLLFSQKFACPDCGVGLPELGPSLFSFNNPAGACPACDGIGATMYVRSGSGGCRCRPVPARRRHRSLGTAQQCLLPASPRRGAAAFDIDLYQPWHKLPADKRKLILEGSAGKEIAFTFEKNGRKHTFKKEFEGVLANLQRRFDEYQRRRREQGRNTDEDFEAVYDEFHRYMSHSPCAECGGTRLRKEARHVRVGGKNIVEVTALTVGQVHEFIRALPLSRRDWQVCHRIVREVTARLSFLISVGVDYLSLDRSAATLSGGEGQRIRLATQIGSGLQGVLYILDEPSIGLHQRDNARLIETLVKLRDLGNTVLVVEHDEDTIRAADYVLDMGPRAGELGGRVVAAGTPEQIEKNPQSLTGAYLSGEKAIQIPKHRRQANQRSLLLRGARTHNLRDLTVSFPLGVLTCVTGVSGSGKSSLIVDTLLPVLKNRLHGARKPDAVFDAIEGCPIDKVIDIDQAPIGRTPRSNPATFTGIFTHIRDLFANLPESKARGYKAGRYSFNVKGGRCEACQGDGILRIEMHFLARRLRRVRGLRRPALQPRNPGSEIPTGQHRRRARHDRQPGLRLFAEHPQIAAEARNPARSGTGLHQAWSSRDHAVRGRSPADQAV